VTAEDRERREREDLRFLVGLPQFQRFLWRAIQLARIFETATDGSHDGAVAALARRNLGLDILTMVEAGQPVPHADGLPILTLIQTLREEATQPLEKPNVRRTNDRYNSDGDDG
jgi:hypothetical protein